MKKIEKISILTEFKEVSLKKRWENKIIFVDINGTKYNLFTFRFDFNPKKIYEQKTIQASEIFLEDTIFDYKVVYFEDKKVKEIIESKAIKYWTFHSSGQINLHFKDKTKLKIPVSTGNSIVRQNPETNLQSQVPILSFFVKYSLLAKTIGVNVNKWASFIYPPLDKIDLVIKYLPTTAKDTCLYHQKSKVKIYNNYFTIVDFANQTSLVLYVNEKSVGKFVVAKESKKLEGACIKKQLKNGTESIKKILKNKYNLDRKEIDNLFKNSLSYAGSDGIIGYDKKTLYSLKQKLFLVFE